MKSLLQAVLTFKHAFDGHVFVGAKGSQFKCSVEYAPFQKIPTPSPKKSARDGTLVNGGYRPYPPLLRSCQPS